MKRSGTRFNVFYSITAPDENDARARAKDICIEQTVEFPPDFITDKYIKNEVLGRTESVTNFSKGRYLAKISYLESTAGAEFTQFLNVLFGNSSIKPGIRVEEFELSPDMYKNFSGPRFGAAGIRKLTAVKNRPLLCSALKPMGMSVKELSELAYKFALGGIDIIKDDHGLANQVFSPFKERVNRCAEAVRKANKKTGGNTIYLPNITADADVTMKRAKLAKKAGAGAVIISAGLTGFTVMKQVADDDTIDLPVFFHPAFSGCYTTSPDSGISHHALYGQLTRLAGADASIFPNFGGRFSFSQEQCAAIAESCGEKMGSIKKSLPAPGGGMSFDSVKKMVSFYGNEVVFLIGGGLFKYDPDITKSVRDLKEAVIKIAR
jgi:ribulose-bisphosphate carboxylase large chain